MLAQVLQLLGVSKSASDDNHEDPVLNRPTKKAQHDKKDKEKTHNESSVKDLHSTKEKDP